jgi:hypothetical protein
MKKMKNITITTIIILFIVIQIGNCGIRTHNLSNKNYMNEIPNYINKFNISLTTYTTLNKTYAEILIKISTDFSDLASITKSVDLYVGGFDKENCPVACFSIKNMNTGKLEENFIIEKETFKKIRFYKIIWLNDSIIPSNLSIDLMSLKTMLIIQKSYILRNF